MAKIQVRLFETTAFSNAKAMRENRKTDKKLKEKKRRTAGKIVRVGKKQFQEMSDKEQQKYLKHFPKSSHRSLLKGEAPKAKPDAKPAEKPTKKRAAKEPAAKPPADKAEKLKKMTREEFEKLPKNQQKAYKKQFPKNSFKGRKHFLEKKPNAVQKRKKGPDGETVLDGNPKGPDRNKDERKALKAERDEARKDLKHGVTQEAVDSLKNSTEADLRAAGENLKKNRSANVKQIKKALTQRPEFVTFDHKDIERAQKALKRESIRDETTWNNRDLNRAKKLLESLKSGETRKLTDKERELLARVGESKPLKKEPFWKRDLKVLKGFVTGERVEPEGRSNAMLALSVVARYALIAGGIAALSMGAAPAALHMAQSLFGQWDGFTANASADDEENEDDVNSAIEMAYDAVADMLSTMDHEEFVESINDTFIEFKAKASDSVDLRSVVFSSDLSEHVRRASAHKVSLSGTTDSILPALVDMLANIGYIATPDGLFSRGDDRVGVYQPSENTVDLLALPSPSSIVQHFWSESNG